MTSNANPDASEAYRVLRTNLQFAGVERPLRALLITSPSPTEGKSLTAANLAAALAQAGRRIILVDADLHRPRLHRIFHLRNNVGVTLALLEDQPNLDDLLQATEIANLRVLTTGPLPPNPAELLGSTRMHSLIAQLESCADLVIMDSPPATALSDAAILSTQTDGVLLVLDAGRTRREMAKRALNGLQQAGAHVIGCVLNRMPTRGGGYYYYYQHYGSYYSSDNGKSHGGRRPAGQSRPDKRRAQPEKPSEAGN